jgi:hypothetical protein
MRRREFVTLLGSATAAWWPFAARAQQTGKPPLIGFFGSSTPAAMTPWITAFVKRLRELGRIEGRTVSIEYRWAEGHNERYAEIANDTHSGHRQRKRRKSSACSRTRTIVVAHVHQRPVHESGKLGLLARPRFLEGLLEVAARRGQRYAHAFGSRFEALPTRDRDGRLRLAVSQAEGASQRFGGRSGRLVRVVDEEDTAGEQAATGFEVRRADGLERHRDQ